TCIVVWIFNDAERVTPAVPLALFAPVDGRMIHADRRRDPWLERPSTRVVVRLPLLGMSVIRCPTEGQIREFWVRGGIGSDGNLETASSPTLYALWIRTDEGDDVVLAVHGRRFISRFRADASPGERVGHGKRLGFIYFGTIVSVYAPGSAEPCSPDEVPRRARVTGGVDRVATLMRSPEPVNLQLDAGKQTGAG
ncbi:MAG: phosphatidylserine decarboxylase, partial [Pseudomonadota bacterium]